MLLRDTASGKNDGRGLGEHTPRERRGKNSRGWPGTHPLLRCQDKIEGAGIRHWSGATKPRGEGGVPSTKNVLTSTRLQGMASMGYSGKRNPT